MTETKWTPSLIEERFVDAADVMKRLPNVRVPGHFNTWPAMMVEFADLIGREPERLRRGPPPPDAISADGRSVGMVALAGTDGSKDRVVARHRRTLERGLLEGGTSPLGRE